MSSPDLVRSPRQDARRPVTIAVVGAGARGTGYAQWALEHPDRATVVAVAEPRDVRRARFADTHSIAPENVFADWQSLAAGPRVADAVMICTQDQMHTEPVLALTKAGYHVMVEKPMAPTEAECRQIVAAAESAGVVFAVGHVMRYTPYTRALKEVVDSGVLGDIMSVQHLEPVGFWHQAHSYVRGNWRREDESSFMLMSKSCHDIDWLQYVLGEPPTKVSSFGRLSHFRPENKPAGAADRCLDCSVESTCPYSAKRFYFDRLVQGNTGWPVDVLIEEYTADALGDALRTGPYGRCVYSCDNDVVDHQVVNMEFASGATGVFTMTAFTEQSDRETKLFGTHGQLTGDGVTIDVYDFLTGTHRTVDPATVGDMTAGGGHGGGDAGLMDSFVAAVAAGDSARVSSGPRESLTSHLTVFAAERARRNGTVEQVLPPLELVTG
ncbi:MAG TPA: Gfo/Idh/MocA family oxidoreductase [Actinocatenispora sp.]